MTETTTTPVWPTVAKMPPAKFSPGDFVRYLPNWKTGGADILCRVESFRANGTWSTTNGQATSHVSHAGYCLTAQVGSRDAMGAEIRPGTVLSVERVEFEEAGDLAPEPATVYGPDRAEDQGDGTCTIVRGQPE